MRHIIESDEIILGCQNYKQIMGCTQCIKKSPRTENIQNKELRSKLIAIRLSDLKPCKMVREGELARVIKEIERNMKQQSRQRCETTQEHITEEEGSQSNFLIDSWKSLVLCSGLDLYEQHLGIDLQVQHQCFADIEKDVGRTFPENKQFQTETKRQSFKEVLQKLGLYFPKLGYTQGINFLVGYLMILGFSQEDTFWMTVHLFLKEEFMFIGFFENQFPLSKVYCCLFKHLFKKNCPQLSEHFERIQVNEEMWIFKWFITAYIYSLPLETIKFIWDYLMVVGGFGLIYLAVSIVKQLETHLKQFGENLEVVQFFSQLRESEVFASLVNLQKVILNSYSLKLSKDEVEQVIRKERQNSKVNNFYVEYFCNYSSFQKRNYALLEWRESKAKERYQFIKSQSKTTFIQKQPGLSRFRVKKERREYQVIELPKIPPKPQQDKPPSQGRERELRIQPITFYPDPRQEIDIGEYVHKISFKKKKNNDNLKQMMQPIRLMKQMSQKVLAKSTPPGIKRKVSRISAISDTSRKSSSKSPSESISVVKAELLIGSSRAIEESIEEICFNEDDSMHEISIESAK